MNRNGFKAAAPEGPINGWDLGRLALAKAGFARSITVHSANTQFATRLCDYWQSMFVWLSI
jgi:hypothetical protein